MKINNKKSEDNKSKNRITVITYNKKLRNIKIEN